MAGLYANNYVVLHIIGITMTKKSVDPPVRVWGLPDRRSSVLLMLPQNAYSSVILNSRTIIRTSGERA